MMTPDLAQRIVDEGPCGDFDPHHDLAVSALTNPPRCWTREPGDDDDDALLPLGDYLDALDLGLIARTKAPPMKAIHWPDHDAGWRAHLAWLVAWTTPRLDKARREFAALKHAGLDGDDDLKWGLALAELLRWAQQEQQKEGSHGT